MIRAITWFCGEDRGVYSPLDRSSEEKSPSFSSSAEVPALIGRPVKYYARMTAETRCCLCAASLAIKAAKWDSASEEIGLLCAGSEGGLRANEEYFRDYVANGRTLGRGNLFIYTLPTSALGEVAIALSLTGPCLFIDDGIDPVASLAKHAEQMIFDGEAGGMLCLWSAGDAAVCVAVGPGEAAEFPLPAIAKSPLLMCRVLREQVRGA